MRSGSCTGAATTAATGACRRRAGRTPRSSREQNVTKKSGGRTYRLYYDGAKLQMVAFEENGAVYWVSNTILHELSNETMIAIAKGLQAARGG